MPTNLLCPAPARQWRQAMIDGVRFDAVTVVDTLLTVPDYKVLENFPWDKTQFMPVGYGKP